MDPALADDNHWVNKARDLFEAQPDLDDAAAFRRLASVLANDLGQMRVRFNPQQHAVPVPYRDDNSYLWDHGESAQPPPEAHALTAGARGRTRRRPRMRRRRTTRRRMPPRPPSWRAMPIQNGTTGWAARGWTAR